MSGRHFLQIPGPTNVPDQILRAIDAPTMDHRGPGFAALTRHILERLPQIFKTSQPVVIYPASGTGAWEAALVNCLSANDRILMCETGQFASLWFKLAEKLGLNPELISTDWRHGTDASAIEARLIDDTAHDIKAVCVVHNETSTGVTSHIKAVREKNPAMRGFGERAAQLRGKGLGLVEPVAGGAAIERTDRRCVELVEHDRRCVLDVELADVPRTVTEVPQTAFRASHLRLQVEPCTEGPPFTGEHDAPHLGVAIGRVEPLGDIVEHRRRNRVHPLWSVERDPRDVVAHLVSNFARSVDGGISHLKTVRHRLGGLRSEMLRARSWHDVRCYLRNS